MDRRTVNAILRQIWTIYNLDQVLLRYLQTY